MEVAGVWPAGDATIVKFLSKMNVSLDPTPVHITRPDDVLTDVGKVHVKFHRALYRPVWGNCTSAKAIASGASQGSGDLPKSGEV